MSSGSSGGLWGELLGAMGNHKARLANLGGVLGPHRCDFELVHLSFSMPRMHSTH